MVTMQNSQRNVIRAAIIVDLRMKKTNMFTQYVKTYIIVTLLYGTMDRSSLGSRDTLPTTTLRNGLESLSIPCQALAASIYLNYYPITNIPPQL